jgi:hypothetical protein
VPIPPRVVLKRGHSHICASESGQCRPTLPFRPDAEQVRLRLGTAFIEHVDDLSPEGEPAATPEWILVHVDGICPVLVELTKHAIDIDDRRWLAATHLVAVAAATRNL